MESRDLLKDQIEQFGRALAKALSDLMSIKSGGNSVLAIEFTQERLKSVLDLDINEILKLKGDLLQAHLMKRTTSGDNIEKISNLFKELAHIHENTDKKKARIFLNKSLELIMIADLASNSYSFDRKAFRDSVEADLLRLRE